MTPTDDDDVDALYISCSLETKLIRIIDNNFMPARLKIRADVCPDDDMTQAEISLALSKIRFFFDNILTKAIAFSYDNESAIDMLINEEGKNNSGNVLMMTPGDPTDELLATLFQAKMEALSGGQITFSLVEVKSDNAMNLAFVFVGDSQNMLPTNEQWIGPRSYFAEPWWNRDDASTLDVIPPPDADLTTKPAWAFSLDVLGGPIKPEPTVLRPEFRPKIIDGGK